MASDKEFVEYVCDQIRYTGEIRYRKMFGEYMVYVNDKPLLLICDNIVYIKMHEVISDLMNGAEIGQPYDGAKPHYILDIDDEEKSRSIIRIIEPLTALPKPKNKKYG